MKHKWLTLAAVTPILLCLAGCPFPFIPIQLDENDDGSAVTMMVGGTLIVTLESNATTGYAWELAELDTTVLENTDQTYTPPASGAAGAPGTETWVFTARGAGTTTLRLEYRRPTDPEGTEPADTFEVTVTVSGFGM